jgi:hypothetical protein
MGIGIKNIRLEMSQFKEKQKPVTISLTGTYVAFQKKKEMLGYATR